MTEETRQPTPYDINKGVNMAIYEIFLAIIAIIGTFYAVYALAIHAKELRNSTKSKQIEIAFKILNERKDLLNSLKDLIVFPRNHVPNFMLRMTITSRYRFDEEQALLATPTTSA